MGDGAVEYVLSEGMKKKNYKIRLHLLKRMFIRSFISLAMFPGFKITEKVN